MDSLLKVAVVPVILLLYFVHKKDPHPESMKFLLKIFGFGCLTTIPVLICELGFDALLALPAKFGSFSILWNTFWGVAFVEEIFKWIVMFGFSYKDKKFDETYDGDGLNIKEILKKGPFAVKKSEVIPGCIIEKIDGQAILKGQDYFPLLEGTSGKNVLLAMYNPATGKRFSVTVKAISTSQQNDLLYKRWVDRNRDMVEKLSGGRIAYVHVKAMDSPSFRTTYSELLSEKNRLKEAVIVDTRHNGGGWLHDDLATLLSGKEYQRFVPHGNYIGSDPFNKWLKPSCVLMCEDNYSNAHGFPWVYKELGIGKLIGAPVPGTMTAVWWETQIDPTLVFGIPQVGCVDMRGNYMENNQLNPDIKVYNRPEDSLHGIDKQLETAVQEMLKAADAVKK